MTFGVNPGPFDSSENWRISSPAAPAAAAAASRARQCLSLDDEYQFSDVDTLPLQLHLPSPRSLLPSPRSLEGRAAPVPTNKGSFSPLVDTTPDPFEWGKQRVLASGEPQTKSLFGNPLVVGAARVLRTTASMSPLFSSLLESHPPVSTIQLSRNIFGSSEAIEVSQAVVQQAAVNPSLKGLEAQSDEILAGLLGSFRYLLSKGDKDFGSSKPYKLGAGSEKPLVTRDPATFTGFTKAMYNFVDPKTEKVFNGTKFNINRLPTSGQHSDVYKIQGEQPLIPGISNDQLLIKTYKNLKTMGYKTNRFIEDAMKQYRQMQETGIRVAKIHNEDTVREDGFFLVERVPHSFNCSWDEKTPFGSLDQATKASLTQLKEIFKIALRYNIGIDGQPDNIKLDEANNIIFIDLREEEEDMASTLVLQWLKAFARGNKEIYEFLESVLVELSEEIELILEKRNSEVPPKKMMTSPSAEVSFLAPDSKPVAARAYRPNF